MERGFRKYMHIERHGSSEVLGIENSECYVFPKIDGANGSIWLDDDGNVCAGSRNKQLSATDDNAGFYSWVDSNANIRDYLYAHPTHRLFGEWLVPHSLKTYEDSAWRNFYIFDVAIDCDGDGGLCYLPYPVYSPMLESYGIDYIKPMVILDSPTYDVLADVLPYNSYLIKKGEGSGEGIVIKNYDFYNQYGRQVWAKIISKEFKNKHFRNKESKEKPCVEEAIAEKYVTISLCEKVYSNIMVANGGSFSSKDIPRLLNSVYYDLVREDCWSFVKEHKNPVIDFKKLHHFALSRVKELLPQVF